jgi:hypothetical protein
MDTKRKVMFSFLALIVIVAGLYFFTDWFSKVTGYFTGESEIERVIECLDKQGVEYYSIINCKECEDQQEILGKSISKIKVDCGSDGEDCGNIKDFPTWFIQGKSVKGVLTLDDLKEISGCE